jgi:urease accessory protein
VIAQVHIQTALAKDSTYLKNCYCTTPLKVVNITEDKTGATLRLMLMSSSPGILDGDEYRLKIDLAENASLQLHTQSYQRLFNMKQQASQKMEVRLQKNAAFCFIPHPAVPHQSSNFTAYNKIFLSAGSSLIFGEILTCGRKLNGEVFLFSKYHNITEIYKDDKLIIKENLLMQPAAIDVHAIGQLQGFTHQASLIYVDENAAITPLKEQVIELLSAQKNISTGITNAPVNGLIVRLLGQKAEQLFDCLKTIAGCLPQHIKSKPTAYAI